MRFLVAMMALGCASVSATPMVLEYSSFYSHVRKLDNEETRALQFAFGFKHIKHNGLCDIDSAYIKTQKQDIPLTVSDEQRFTVPVEKALKLAQANVIVDVRQEHNLCDMSVQLETTPDYLKTQYSAQDLRDLDTQYAAFFDDMGGLFSFLMPSTSGLIVHLAPGTRVLSERAPQIDGDTLVVDEQWLANNDGLSLSLPPKRITARVER